MSKAERIQELQRRIKPESEMGKQAWDLYFWVKEINAREGL